MIVVDTFRRGLPLWIVAAALLAVTVIFGDYLLSQQREADARAERQRQAICAILANIPGHIPPEIAKARKAFARHPRECDPLHPIPLPRYTVLLKPGPDHTTVVLVPAPGPSHVGAGGSSTPSRSPAPAHTRTPSPRPASSRSPTPTPSPSKSCTVHVDGVVCV